MGFQLPSSVSSAQDVSSLIREVHDYSTWFSHSLVKQRVGSKKLTDQPELSPAAVEVIRGWAGKAQLTQAKLDELIQLLEEFKTTAPTLTITLAAPPTGDIKKVLVEWCRKNVAPNVLVTFRFNSSLLGGMVVRYGSQIFDWSFRRKILANKDTFPEVLRRV